MMPMMMIISMLLLLSKMPDAATFPQVLGKSIDMFDMKPYVDLGSAHIGMQTIVDTTNMNDADIAHYTTKTGAVKVNTQHKVYNSVYDFSDALSVDAGLSVGIGAFKATATISLGAASKIGQSRYYAHTKTKYTQSGFSFDFSSLFAQRRFVKPSFIADVEALVEWRASLSKQLSAQYAENQHEQWEVYFEFLKRYGSHIVSGYNSGFCFEMIMSQAMSSTSTISDMSASASASYGMFASGHASKDTSTAQSGQSNDFTMSIIFSGGEMASAAALESAASAAKTAALAGHPVDSTALNAAYSKWIASAVLDSTPAVIYDAVYKGWETVLPVMNSYIGERAVLRQVAKELKVATRARMLLQWKADCPPGQWNADTLRCEPIEHRSENLTALTSNKPILIQTDLDKLHFLKYDKETRRICVVDDMQSATAFMFKCDVDSTSSMFAIDADRQELQLTTSAGGSSFSPTEGNSSPNGKIEITASQQIRLQGTRQLLCARQGCTEVVFSEYPGNLPSALTPGTHFNFRNVADPQMTMARLLSNQFRLEVDGMIMFVAEGDNDEQFGHSVVSIRPSASLATSRSWFRLIPAMALPVQLYHLLHVQTGFLVFPSGDIDGADNTVEAMPIVEALAVRDRRTEWEVIVRDGGALLFKSAGGEQLTAGMYMCGSQCIINGDRVVQVRHSYERAQFKAQFL